MGTINYKTSDFITIGYNCDYIDYEDEYCHDIVSDYYDQVKYRLDQESFYYFSVTLEPGYYEGFYLIIENMFPACYDSSDEKQLAHKEITRIRAFLTECINDFECCSVYPGWCTGHADYKRSLKDLSAAIKEMHDTVKKTPTERQYCKRFREYYRAV